MVQAENLPPRLRETGLFCCWRYENRQDKPTKVPYNPRTGGGAQSTNPDTFAPLAVALAAVEREGYTGVGVGLFGHLGAIDIDHCIDDNGELSPLAFDVMDTMQAYTEYSPSGHGLRILFTVPESFRYDKVRYYTNNQKAGLEVYIAGATNKYVTVTGDALTPGLDLEERGEQLAAVLKKHMVRPQRPTPSPAPAGGTADLDDLALIERAKQGKNGAAFSLLWDGNTTGYNSSSEADMALCNALAWWTNKDPQQVDNLFRQSGLMREKWDRRQSGSTYGAITVQNAVATCRGGYNPASYRQGHELAWSAPIGGAATPEGPQFAWEPPVPFDTIEAPGFPVETLPGPLGSFVECLAESTQTPEEMAGVLSLGILATAYQSKYTVQVTPDWREPLCLYPVAVAPPGERKSAVISALTKPVYEYEAERREAEAAEIAQNQTERVLLEKALASAQTNAVKKKESMEAGRIEALDLAAQLAEFKDKHPFRLLVDDTTTEKLIDLMEMQNGSITVASAEGGVFDAMAGRYDRNANFDVYLKGHAGDPISVDRIGRKSNYVPDPRLTMILTIQPDVLSGLMSNSTMKGRGLCGRYLYAICKSKVGRRKVSPDAIPPDVRMKYREFVRRILSDQGGGTIYLSREADKIREDYQAHIEKKLGNEWEFMRDWGGKLVGAMVRIAALIHAASIQGNPTEIPISPEIMDAAVKIAEFLGPHAEAAYQIMGSDDVLESAKYLWRRIESSGKDEISKRDLFAKCQSKFKKAENMEPAMQVLIDRGYIRMAERKTNGRPSVIIFVNPTTKGTEGTKA